VAEPAQGPGLVPQRRVLQDVESKQLGYDLLSSNDFATCFHWFAASLTHALAYGRRMSRGDEEEIVEIDGIMRKNWSMSHCPRWRFRF
jgi:hypothetical protein